MLSGSRCILAFYPLTWQFCEEYIVNLSLTGS